MTNSLHRRMLEHRFGEGSGFTPRYFVTKLVYFEVYEYGNDKGEARDDSGQGGSGYAAWQEGAAA